MQAGASMLLPPLLPMELMLPLLSRGALLMGEITTALLAAHWLRPDLEVRCMGLARGGYAERARALFQCVGIADDQDEDEGEGEGEDALPGIRAQRTNTRA